MKKNVGLWKVKISLVVGIWVEEQGILIGETTSRWPSYSTWRWLKKMQEQNLLSLQV